VPVVLTETVRPASFFVVGRTADVEIICLSDGQALAPDAAPTTVVTAPDGAVALASVSAGLGVGVYRIIFTALQRGSYSVAFTASVLTVPVAGSAVVNVNDSLSIVSLNEARQHLGITNYDEDGKLTAAIAAAVEQCERITGLTWRKSIIVDRFLADGARIKFNLKTAPCINVTCTVDGASVTPSDVNSSSGIVELGSVPANGSDVVFSYTSGPENNFVPSGIRQGCLEVVAAYYMRQRGGSNLPRQDEFGPSPWSLPLTVTNSYGTGLWDTYSLPQIA
jgi:hypothetical protein